MKPWTVVSALASLIFVLAANAQDEKAVVKELDALNGKWKITKFETPGGENNDVIGAVLTFDKNAKSIQLEVNGQEKKGKFTLNPAGKPKELTFMPEGEDKEIPAIYYLEKDTLKICAAAKPGEARPTEFKSGAGAEGNLLTLERVK